MKITKENAVLVKNTYFCVTVFLVGLVLALVIFSIIAILKNTIFKNVDFNQFYLVMAPIQLGLNILIWYIAAKIGLYNIFNSKKIAKKNLLPLRKAVIRDGGFFMTLMFFVSLSNIVNIMIILLSSLINLSLLKRGFDKQATLHYGNIKFE